MQKGLQADIRQSVFQITLVDRPAKVFLLHMLPRVGVTMTPWKFVIITQQTLGYWISFQPIVAVRMVQAWQFVLAPFSRAHRNSTGPLYTMPVMGQYWIHMGPVKVHFTCNRWKPFELINFRLIRQKKK